MQPGQVYKADPVIIVPYDPEWARRFQQLAEKLRAALQSKALRIDHIGSTAIPGLAAKPVIDIQISVAALEPVEAYGRALESLRYVFRADNTDLSKRYFREKPGTRRTHIHVRQAGSWGEQLNLLFRDYLRVHEQDASQYAQVKIELAERYRNDRMNYVAAKAEFIWEILMKANRWSQDVGWQPGASDR
jgi:GrpB-like predicted nucleotidyltransferase (UPF0157 family)